MATNPCEECLNYEYDEEFDDYTCCVSLDMDEYQQVVSGGQCPFYRPGDEYTIVRKQN